MPRSLGTLALGATLTLALAGPAAADSEGVGPVRAPHVVATHHLTFHLAGDSWAQVAGTLSGQPALGTYTFQDGPTPPPAVTGHLIVWVNARTAARPPSVRGGRLTFGSATVRVDHHGTSGSIRWWSGVKTTGQPMAFGYQRAPQGLRTRARPWLVFAVATEAGANGQDLGPVLEAGAPKVRSIIRSLRLAPGPVVVPPGPVAYT